MNPFQQMQQAESKVIEQIDRATTEVDRIGRGPVDDACVRLEFALAGAAARLREGPERAGEMLRRFLGQMSNAAEAAADLLPQIEMQPVALLTDATVKPKKGKQ